MGELLLFHQSFDFVIFLFFLLLLGFGLTACFASQRLKKLCRLGVGFFLGTILSFFLLLLVAPSAFSVGNLILFALALVFTIPAVYFNKFFAFLLGFTLSLTAFFITFYSLSSVGEQYGAALVLSFLLSIPVGYGAVLHDEDCYNFLLPVTGAIMGALGISVLFGGGSVAAVYDVFNETAPKTIFIILTVLLLAGSVFTQYILAKKAKQA